MHDTGSLRTTFNREAELYDAVRPRYPDELFDWIIGTTQLPKNAELLEIGPGTGQATEPFAQRGYAITAVELGSASSLKGWRAYSCYRDEPCVRRKGR